MTDDRRERFLDFLGDFRRLQGFVEVGLDGDGRRTIASSQDGLLGTDLYMPDLTQGNHATAAVRQRQLTEPCGVKTTRGPLALLAPPLPPYEYPHELP